jgi:RNA polymerase sigma-70 factor (ECF subfamily)
MDVTQEKQLLERLCQKDPAAMRWLYDHYSPFLMGVCRRYLPGKADAEDALQDVFIRVFEKIKTFRQLDGSSLQGWMTRIAVNMCISKLRKRKVLDFITLQDEQVVSQEEEPDLDQFSQETIMRAIGALPDGYRTVLNLYVFDQMSHREIASLLGISEGTSASQLHRARGLLWKKLKELKP